MTAVKEIKAKFVFTCDICHEQVTQDQAGQDRPERWEWLRVTNGRTLLLCPDSLKLVQDAIEALRVPT